MKITFSRVCLTLLGLVALTLGLSIPAVAAEGPPNFNPIYSGYATPYGHSYYGVGGNFTVPKVDCLHSSQQAGTGAAAWVGLGGISVTSPRLNGSTLVQVGTEAVCQYGIYPDYGAVWEVIPPGSHLNFAIWVCGGIGLAPLPGPLCKYPVKPGDYIIASVNYLKNGNYSMAMLDTTQGWTWTKAISVKDHEVPTTAEWVVEAGAFVLANFNPVTFTASAYSTAPDSKFILLGTEGTAVAEPYEIPSVTTVTPVNPPGQFSVSYIGATSFFG